MIKSHIRQAVGYIFHRLQACHVAYLESATRRGFKRIGDNVILSECSFNNKERIELGNHIYLGPKGNFFGLGGITIESYSILAPEILILSSVHNYDWKTATMVPYDNVELLKPVIIRQACWIGMRCIILPGVELGPGCVIGAGSVVTKSWPAGTILAGAPAKPIRQRDMSHFQFCSNNNNFYMLQKSLYGLTKKEKYSGPQISHANEKL